MYRVSALSYTKCLEKWSCVFQVGYLEIMATCGLLSLFVFSHKTEIIEAVACHSNDHRGSIVVVCL